MSASSVGFADSLVVAVRNVRRRGTFRVNAADRDTREAYARICMIFIAIGFVMVFIGDGNGTIENKKEMTSIYSLLQTQFVLVLILRPSCQLSLERHFSRRKLLSVPVVGGAFAFTCISPPPWAAAVAAPIPISPEDASSTIRAARDALSILMANWDKSTIDCSVADVSRDLLEQKNKAELLEKAATFALFDKDGAVMSCKEDNKKVRNFIGKLKNLDRQFASARDIIIDADGDLEEYFSLVDDYSRRMSAANSLSYSAGQDFSAINTSKMNTEEGDVGKQELAGGKGDNMLAAQSELMNAREDIDKICSMLSCDN